MNEGEQQKNIQAIVVLTGGKDRIQTGLKLLSKERMNYLFISGTGKNFTIEKLTAPPALQTKIILGPKATNTRENATETEEWLEQNKINHFYLVTSNYHMARSLMEFKNIMPEKNIVPWPVYPQDFKPGSPGYWRLTFAEYNKTLLSWLRLKLML